MLPLALSPGLGGADDGRGALGGLGSYWLVAIASRHWCHVWNRDPNAHAFRGCFMDSLEISLETLH